MVEHTKESPERTSVGPSQSGSDSRRDRWNKAEVIAKIATAISAFSVPVVLFYGGYMVQKQLQDQAVRRDYVQLAVSILKEPGGLERDDDAKGLRKWAVAILKEYSKIPLPEKEQQLLESGSTSLPPSSGITTMYYQPFSLFGPRSGVSPFVLGSLLYPQFQSGVIGELVVNPVAKAFELNEQGLQSLLSRDVDSATQAFMEVEKLLPFFPGIQEVRKLLQEKKQELAAPPVQGKRDPWKEVYGRVLAAQGSLMPRDIKETMISRL